jgi:small GTP-binding protein
MGSTLSAKILFLGLDGAGKTSLLTFLKEGPNDLVPKPSVGFETKEVKYKGVLMSVYDPAGGPKVRDLWKHYYAEVDAVVWIVDCADVGRFAESKQALSTALKDASMSRDCPLLVAANKCDIAGAKSEDEIKKALDLENLLKNRVWAVNRTNSKQGEGISDSFKWLSAQIKLDYKRKRSGK